MNAPIKFFTFICDPLERMIRHYNFSNTFNQVYTFEEYYLNFGTKDDIGWTGKYDRTNNYFANYLGFPNKESITRETISDRFAGVLLPSILKITTIFF